MMVSPRIPASGARRIRWRLRALALLLVLLAMGAIHLFAPGLPLGMDERAAGFWWRAAPLKAIERRIVVVDIDEKSLTEIGPWPWPREKLATLATRLGELGTHLQAFDIVLAEPRPGDDTLSKAAQTLPLVLGEVLVVDPSVLTPPHAGQLRGALDATPCTPYTRQAFGYLGVAESLHIEASGHITPSLSRNGSVRGAPALICYQGRVYPSLALASLLRASDLAAPLSVEPGRGLLDPPWRISHPQLPGISIPIDEHGEWLASYQLPRSSLVSISAADILQGHAPAELLRGTWALVGATALGIADAVPTPLGATVSGVEVHAQLLSALLDDRTPYAPRGQFILQALSAAFSAAVLLALLGWRQRAVVAILPIAGLLLAAGLYAGQGYLLLAHHLWIGASLPAAFAILAGATLAVIELAVTRRERELVYNNLSSYLPRSAAAAIAFRAPVGNLEAQHEELVLLHADLRNFSAWCEQRPAEESAAVLHLFFSLCAHAVREHGGVIEEYVGDAILAIWPGHADPAKVIAAARQIVEHARDALPPPAEGLEPLAVGVGIEQGRVLVGSFGPAWRRNHTVLGQAVTVAIRLQQLTSELAQSILLGPTIALRLPHHQVRRQGVFLLEGLMEPREVFAVNSSESIIAPGVSK